MPAVGQHEASVATQQQGRAVHRIPRGDVVVAAGHGETVQLDLLQVDGCAAYLQAGGVGQRVELEEVQQVAMQCGGQARAVGVPVQDVEGWWCLAEQVVVDPVVPDQVVGPHPGEDPRHFATIQHAALVGATLGGLDGLLVGEQACGAFELAVQQADQVGGTAYPAQLVLGLQVALQRGHGQAAGAGAHQVGVAVAADAAAGVERFFQGLHVAGQAPFAVARVGVAPADHEHLQAILEHVLDEAVGRAQVEDVELVDLRGHHQQRPGVLLFAHRLVLDQLQQFVAKHHGTGGRGQVAAHFEGALVDLAWQAVVVAQVIEQMGHAAYKAQATAVEQFLDRQRVEQRVARCQGIVDQVEQEVRTGPVIVVQVAFLDPQAGLLLPGQVGLQTAPVERVLAPCRVVEARIARVRLKRCVTQQHPAQLTTQGQQVMCGVQRVTQALAADIAQRGNQVATAQAEDGVLHVHAGGGKRWRSFGRFVFHGNTPSS
ncbi:hypothetical protein D3C76_803620 [compost metagenome]